MFLKKYISILIFTMLFLTSCTTMKFYLEPVDKKDPDIVKIKKFPRKLLKEFYTRKGLTKHQFDIQSLCGEKDLVYFKTYMHGLREVWCK